MKTSLFILIALLAVPTTKAAGLPRESFGGAVWGAVIGGLAGGDCRNAWSGKGAAIGAGVGFVAGTIAGESRRAAERHYYYSQPTSHTYTQPIITPRTQTQSPRPRVVPNAPRVPDAPTF